MDEKNEDLMFILKNIEQDVNALFLKSGFSLTKDNIIEFSQIVDHNARELGYELVTVNRIKYLGGAFFFEIIIEHTDSDLYTNTTEDPYNKDNAFGRSRLILAMPYHMVAVN